MRAISIDSPVGRLVILAEDGAIARIDWADGADFANSAETPLLADARRQLAAYFAGRLRHFDLPLRPHGSPFDHKVWAAMRQIPYGETRSYGDLARAIGSAPRAVGNACGNNPIPIVIPCHRVLARGGLGGYSGNGGVVTKRALLTLEGAAAPALL
jgi:methylated-DNA-[protein]-cysteine S-methyltransferase